MSTIEVNGTALYYELHGDGDPLVLSHGSWADAEQWRLVLPKLAESFQVLVFDRRGHSRSEGKDDQSGVREDCGDLAGLLEALELAPAHVATNSSGGNIALRLATDRPELFRSLTCHEPPLIALLPESDDDGAIGSVAAMIAAGDHEAAAQEFVNDVAVGPGVWEGELTPEERATFVRNAPTFLGELNDPEFWAVDLGALASLDLALRFTQGSESPPLYAAILDRVSQAVPQAPRETFDGAGHVPHLTHAAAYAESVKRAADGAA